MLMSDYEIDEIRQIRHQISAEHGHDLRKIAEHYRKLEKKLRESGQFKFADQSPQEVSTEKAEGRI
jgi:hypothetical protein